MTKTSRLQMCGMTTMQCLGELTDRRSDRQTPLRFIGILLDPKYGTNLIIVPCSHEGGQGGVGLDQGEYFVKCGEHQ